MAKEEKKMKRTLRCRHRRRFLRRSLRLHASAKPSIPEQADPNVVPTPRAGTSDILARQIGPETDRGLGPPGVVETGRVPTATSAREIRRPRARGCYTAAGSRPGAGDQCDDIRKLPSIRRRLLARWSWFPIADVLAVHPDVQVRM